MIFFGLRQGYMVHCTRERKWWRNINMFPGSICLDNFSAIYLTERFHNILCVGSFSSWICKAVITSWIYVNVLRSCQAPANNQCLLSYHIQNIKERFLSSSLSLIKWQEAVEDGNAASVKIFVMHNYHQLRPTLLHSISSIFHGVPSLHSQCIIIL